MPFLASHINRTAMNHFGSARCESLKMVPVVTEKRYRHALQSYCRRVLMREIDSEPQRRHETPAGHRNSSRMARHSASVSNASISLGSVILAVFVMVRPKKRANELTDKELVKRLFP